MFVFGNVERVTLCFELFEVIATLFNVIVSDNEHKTFVNRLKIKNKSTKGSSALLPGQ